MCGIVGLVHNDLNRLCEESTIIVMRDLLVHRGPDDKGLYVDKNIGLGHRRLSIIDLGTGHQPMTNEDGSILIVYNGEIYNFKELRHKLLNRGHIFKTNSDTEVILHLYEEEGSNCVNELNGMFAFAIWDKKNHSLLLARDRLGIKPLYYAQTNDTFLFSSEIKSILKSGLLQAKCNNEAVPEYFIFRDVAGDKTLFDGINKLMPGSVLVLKDGRIHINQYWSNFQEYQHSDISFNEAEEKLKYLINDSVKIRLMSDVPLGTFCSGGVDSSFVSALATQLTGQPINTFSVGFHEKEYDETYYARIVSNEFNSKHHEIKLTNNEFTELLPEMIWHNDEPLNYANSVLIYALSKLSKKFVTVVLTGEGSDEIFLGYPRYNIPKMLLKLKRLKSVVGILSALGAALINDHRIEKIKQNIKFTDHELLLYNSSFLPEDYLHFLKIVNHSLYDFRSGCIKKGQKMGYDPLNNLSLLDQQCYLLSILNRQDKMSMAASIESRVPLLDYRIVEFTNSLPPEYKIKYWEGKYIFKKIAKKILPRKIINRKKSGFGVPLNKWMCANEGLGLIVNSLLDHKDIKDYFDRTHLEKIIFEQKSGLRDHSDFLWPAINFFSWKNIYNV